MTSVIAAAATRRAFLAAFMPQPAWWITGAGRDYLLFSITGRCEDLTFIDPVDGELLVENKHFTTESEARAWIEADIALRVGKIGGAQ